MFQDRKEHAQPLKAKTHHRKLSINIYGVNNDKVMIRLRGPDNYLSPTEGYVRFLLYLGHQQYSTVGASGWVVS